MASAAFAQSAEEILEKMELAMGGFEKEGMVMTVETKIPVLGTILARTWTLGDKVKFVTKASGTDFVSYTDQKTAWSIDVRAKEITITDIDASSSSSAEDGSGDAEMFEGITDGYDVSIQKETDDAWYILAQKSKNNKEKDAPKSMDIVVAKGTYYPVSLSTKMSGITMIMKDIEFGVSEEDVTFDVKKYPKYLIKDKRK